MKGRSYTVTYNSACQWSVLTQQWGSHWPRLLPYCLLNTSLMCILQVALAHGIDLNISEVGHTFMSLVVGFLVVSRVSMSLARYNEAREYLEMMNKSFRQLVHTACIYSNTDEGEIAKQWRHEVVYRALILLRASMAVIDHENVKDIPELAGAELEDIQRNMPPTRWLHDARTDYEENLRIPIRLSYLVRKSIRSQEGRVVPTIPVIAEGDLYAFLNTYMDGYYGIHKFMTTPVPFPLIQMTSTFLWFYLFTVPFALLSADDISILAAASHCMVVFILTYGLVGMEFVSISMDDPFGDDENDFNNLALSRMAFEDAYMTVEDVDGVGWADMLRNKMHDNSAPVNEQSWLLGGTGSKNKE
jgi:predicted membrane chloride channel (bestrophin family)